MDARAKKYKWKNAGVGKGQGRAGFSQLTLIKMIANKTIASCLHPGVFQSARNLANDKDMPDGVLQESHQLFVRTYMRLVEMPSADSKFILRGPQILAVPPRLARDEVEDQLKRAARESTDTSWAPAKKRK